MCGIAGIISKNPLLVSTRRIKNATDVLQHRGPEGEGFYINTQKTVTLGHRRLCIIDLSDAAAQPMSYLDRYQIIFNGELYNYIEVRTLLKDDGYHFFTGSDTEVVVAAFAKWGAECLQQFDGAFAFAIWDEKEEELFAARDRFGEKPFYFFYNEEQLVFASEMKALWSMDVKKVVNTKMLYNFLSIDYLNNPGDPQETFFNDIHKLPAGSFLTYSINKHELIVQKYWQVYPETDDSISGDEVIDRFTSLFASSISNRMRSDVPVGTSLSGGLDSSMVVAFCDEKSSTQYSHKCFTAAFSNFEKNELHHAQMIAKQFGLQHHVTEIDENKIISLMDHVMKQQEEPITSASALAQYAVFQTAKENGVTVLFDGQGADELLAGYQKYYRWYWMELYKKKQLKRSGEVKAAQLLGIGQSFPVSSKIAALAPHLASSLLQGRKQKMAFQNTDLNRDFAFSHKRDLYYSTPSHFDLNSALYFNTFVQGLEDLLRMADRNSMAHAIEVRLPFLHYKLVEFLFSVPSHYKIHNGWTKWLLRKAGETKLPKEIVWRKDKIGFEPPQKKWMQHNDVQHHIVMAKQKLVEEGILDKTVLLKKIQPHDAYVAENKDWKYWSASYLFR